MVRRTGDGHEVDPLGRDRGAPALEGADDVVGVPAPRAGEPVSVGATEEVVEGQVEPIFSDSCQSAANWRT